VTSHSVWWIDQHEADNTFGMTRRVRAHDPTTKRVANQHTALSIRDVRDHRSELVDNAREGQRA
jgi:hypothetical protein